jgi:hypothetical protein
MQKLVVQIIVFHWDKSQLSDAHKKARARLPDRYPLKSSSFALSNEQILLDKHGDDISGNHIRYQLTDDYFLIDRFRVDLKAKTVEFKARLQVDETPIYLTTINEGWIKCEYQWRYRVEEGGFIYWLYEKVIVNICFLNEFDSNVFIDNPAQQRFENLLEIH